MKKINSINLFLFFLLDSVSNYPKYHSQFKQDKFVNENFFKNKKNGVFIDIGASDGVKISNTLFFERELGWHGICFEPLPVQFEKLQKNRNCICINAAISEKNGKADFAWIQSPGVSNELSGIIEKYDPRHIESIKNRIQKFGGKLEVITIECLRLNDVLEKYNIFHIDYLSIDTEGGELDILQSIDYEKFNIEIIDVENSFNNAKFKQFLETKGYRLVKYLRVDEIYKKSKLPILQQSKSIA